MPRKMHKYDVLKSHIMAFIIACILVVIAHYFAVWLNNYHFLSAECISWIQSFSIIPMAVVVYGQLSWDIQTWDGKTPAEKLNKNLFKIISAIGFFFAILAFHLKP